MTKNRRPSISRRRFMQTAVAPAAAAFLIPDLSLKQKGERITTPGQLFWGELHTHTMLSDGNGTPEENFEIAKSHLDFWCMADHAYDEVIFSRASKVKSKKPELLNDHWERIQKLCRSYEEPGRFIPILGYEWTNFRYGHHNVYYYDYDQPIRMPPTLTALYSELKDVKAFVIPHHTGYPVRKTGKDWDYFDEHLSPFAEIYSLHGSSEEPKGVQPLLTGGSWMGPGESGGSIQEGLARGYKFGISASSDSHGGHPGAYDLGLTGVYASDLSRKSLWDAFQRRRIFGVTGDRISLDFSVNGHPMGSVMNYSPERKFNISAVAWDKVDRIDIIKNNGVVHSFVEPTGKPVSYGKLRFRFILEWGWDRNDDQEWEGKLAADKGTILQAVQCFRGSVNNCVGRGIKSLSSSECRWNSKVNKVVYPIFLRQHADAIAFEVESPENSNLQIILSCSGFDREIILPVKDIIDRDRLIYMDEVPPDNMSNYWSSMKTQAKFKIHKGYRTDSLTLNLDFEDDKPEHPKGLADFYYIRLLQKNGQRAWSSPLWVQR